MSTEGAECGSTTAMKTSTQISLPYFISNVPARVSHHPHFFQRSWPCWPLIFSYPLPDRLELLILGIRTCSSSAATADGSSTSCRTSLPIQIVSSGKVLNVESELSIPSFLSRRSLETIDFLQEAFTFLYVLLLHIRRYFPFLVVS